MLRRLGFGTTCWSLICLGIPVWAAVLSLPRHSPVPGGVAVIPLDVDASEPPAVRYDDRMIMVVRDGDRWVAVVGIPLDTPPDSKTRQIQSASSDERQQTFAVCDKHYREGWITIKNKRMVYPNQKDRERIAKASGRIANALLHWTAGVVEEPF